MVATHTATAQSNNVESMLRKAAAVRVTSDSLKTLWAAEWKKSDSLRIESMFLRMKSDSLLRVATGLIANAKKIVADSIQAVAFKKRSDSIANLNAADTVGLELRVVDSSAFDTTDVDLEILKQMKSTKNIQSAVTTARNRLLTARSTAGKTFSDSITALVLRFRPDTGYASYYAEQFHGKKTSSGQPYNMNANTCAHRWLPYGTRLLVTNIKNNKSCVVQVTDRGPFKHGRIIDISKSAAKEIDMIRHGTSIVEIRVADAGKADTDKPVTGK